MAKKTIKLKSPGHVFVGGKLYEADADGFVRVPVEHKDHLVETHGCVDPSEEQDEPDEPAAE